MRITNNQLTSNYLFNANRTLEKLTEQHEKCETGRAFKRISQNVSAGKKALQARTAMYRNEQYQKNVSAASEQMTTAEASLTSINDQLQNVKSLCLKAVNGPNTDDTSRDIFAATLNETKASILDDINAQHVDKYIFGGTNNKEIPFTVDDEGDICFNGTKLDDLTCTDGVYFDKDGNEVPMSGDTYVDIGKGLRMNGDTFDKNSAFKISFQGAEWTGYGKSEMSYTDKDGNEVTEEVSNNVYQILTQMQNALENNDTERLSALNDHLDKQFDHLLTGIAELGVKSKTLETTKSKLEDENDSIAQMQQDIEGINDTDEIVKLEEYNYAWALTLKFGSTVLPNSLMDYIK